MDLLQQIQVFVVTFCSIVWEALPFIVLGALVAGVLEELLPQQLIGKVMPPYALPAVVIGGLLGLIFPMCECGIVVVMRRLLRKGLPLACCISYMMAGPIMNAVVLFSTYAAFSGFDPAKSGVGLEMVLLRAGMGFVVACVTGLIVHRLEKRAGLAALLTPVSMPPAAPPRGLSLGMVDAPPPPAPVARKSVAKRLANISQTTLHDFVDITVFLILGAVLAALAKLVIQPEQVEQLSREMPYLAIPAMMALAVVMCLCSEADAFVAASFTEMAASSKLAFLVLGPMLDLKLLLMYTRVFRPKLIGVLVACSVIQVFAYSNAVHLIYNPSPAAVAGATSVAAPAPAPPAPATK